MGTGVLGAAGLPAAASRSFDLVLGGDSGWSAVGGGGGAMNDRQLFGAGSP